MAVADAKISVERAGGGGGGGGNESVYLISILFFCVVCLPRFTQLDEISLESERRFTRYDSPTHCVYDMCLLRKRASKEKIIRCVFREEEEEGKNK
ncbi:hypothetical protein OUZ56_025122 [Daphnia magna]|uniref:Uncharacterized protein n=1 Tax=Daphnia magna TaxID=35525 RepID=A0ABQ9ZIX4_9CRUS|nr:hypothetical protein OUZ56_025122 [Daphnia magna]